MAIRDNAPAAEIDQKIDNTAELYYGLQTAVANHLAETPSTQASTITAESLAPLVRQLYEMLEACEMNVQPLVRSQQPALAALFGEQLLAFDNLVASFDFEGALTLLDESCKVYPKLASLLPDRSFGPRE
jgi:hypothetical protein